MSAAGVALVGEGGTAPLVAVAAVIVVLATFLLIAQETARAAAGGRRSAVARTFAAGATPMLVAFAIVVGVQVARILG